jgi:uncharacterized membrane protein YfcA
MPAMITILKMEPRAAIGANPTAAFVMGMVYFVNNNIDYFVVLGSGAMIGEYLGAKYTNRFKERVISNVS